MKFSCKFDLIDTSLDAQEGFKEDVIDRITEIVSSNSSIEALDFLRKKYVDHSNNVGIFFYDVIAI